LKAAPGVLAVMVTTGPLTVAETSAEQELLKLDAREAASDAAIDPITQNSQERKPAG